MAKPTQTEIKLARLGGEKYQSQLYAQYVSELIREKYSVNTELAILRQRDTKPAEFEAYNEFAENCKDQARALIYGE